MKKLLAILLTVAIAGLVVAGCSKSDDNAAAGTGSGAAATGTGAATT